MRRSVNFTDPQLVWLRAESARLGITVSDLVRRVVDRERERDRERDREPQAGWLMQTTKQGAVVISHSMSGSAFPPSPCRPGNTSTPGGPMRAPTDPEPAG